MKYLRDRFYLGLLMAMALHFTGNFPIFMGAEGYFGWERATWQYVLSFWVPVYFLLLLMLLVFLMTGKARRVGRVLLGRRVCPSCHHRYDIPLFGFNMGLVEIRTMFALQKMALGQVKSVACLSRPNF